ncbi:MAG: SGNH/GDSL hydrolase family protein [Prevotellaceae bacterium]|nr:SGNH/GDSL hydrolase family protein [Prevotellaceae bacterium]
MDVKRIIGIFLLLFSWSFFGCFGHKDLFVPVDDVHIQYEGRFFSPDSTRLRLDYPGTRIRLSYDGTDAFIKLKPSAGYFSVSVDGGDPFKFNSASCGEDGLFRLTSGLERGKHTVEVTLVSEGLFDQPEFFGFLLDGDAELLTLPAKKHRMEFIGNSITCGYGVEAANEDEKFNDSTSNFVKSYAALTAKAFDAEMMVVARSGIGAYRNFDDKPEGSLRPMPVVYENILISGERTQWDFSRFTPDVLCVNLGTNDLSTTGCRLDLLENAYRNFISRIRANYPATKIVLLSGCMVRPGEGLEELRTILDRIAGDFKKAGDENIFRFDFTPHDGSLGYGADWHPSAGQQQKMSFELIPFLSSITGWKVE